MCVMCSCLLCPYLVCFLSLLSVGAGSSGGHGGAGSSGGHDGAGISGGHGGAGSSGGHGRWSFMAVASSLGQATQAGTLLPLPPKKNSLGKLGGIRSPPGLDRQDKTGTGQPSRAKQTGTGQPTGARHTGTGSPPGLARKLRLLLGMTRSQGPSQGPSATASTSATRGQAAGNGLRGHYKKSRLPQTSLHGQDRQDTLKLFLRARQDLKNMTLGTWHGTPGRDVDWIHGARVSGDWRA